jgi:hypothetical protein
LIRNRQNGSKRSLPNHILDEPLISFEGSKDEAKDYVNIKDTGVYPSKSSEGSAIVTSEKQIRVCSEPPPSQLPAESPNGPSMETSSNEGNTLPKLSESLGESSETDTSSPGAATDSERETMMQSSASEVGTEDLASFEAAPPPHSKDLDQQHPNLSAKDFIRNNDKPKSVDNSCQGNSAGSSAKRPGSRASNTATRTSHSSSSSGDGAALHLEVIPGTILVAQSSFTKKVKMHVGVRPGDRIKVIKKVSGITYHGENLTTKHSGQFPSSVFEKSKQAWKKNSLIEKQRAIAEPNTAASVKKSSLSSSGVGNDLDKVEGMNAAEWDKDDSSVATAPVSLSRQELASGKYSVLADLESQSQSSEPGEEEFIRAMINKMLDEKV